MNEVCATEYWMTYYIFIFWFLGAIAGWLIKDAQVRHLKKKKSN